MGNNNKCVDFFATELSYIYNPDIRETATEILRAAPDYFLVIPSSTTGKYHPEDEITVGGKALHTKRVVFLVRELGKMDNLQPKPHDLLVAAALVHDLFFKDVPERKHSTSIHPELLRKYTEKDLGHLPYYTEILDIAEKHSGRWGTTAAQRPKQKLKADKMLHVADYIASRRPIHVHVSSAGGKRKANVKK